MDSGSTKALVGEAMETPPGCGVGRGDRLNTLDIAEILERIPHRYPFILIDRVLDYEADQWLLATKNVSINEPYFQGHFPRYPILPGVLTLEAMAQAAAVLTSQGMKGRTELDVYLFVGIDKAKFKRPVLPGDQLGIEVMLTRKLKGMLKFSAEAFVDGMLCASAQLTCAYRRLETTQSAPSGSKPALSSWRETSRVRASFRQRARASQADVPA